MKAQGGNKMELLTKSDLAKALKVSRPTVNNYLKKGMPHYKVSRAVRFDFEEVKKWIKEEMNKGE